MATSTKASAKVVDFSNVKEAGQFAPRRVPAGDYAAKIIKVEDGKSGKDGEFQYIFAIKLTAFSQNTYPYYCKLQENQLWKLRNLLIAGGINVPKRKAQIDPNRLVGKVIGVTMGDDEYDGKEKSTIEAVFPASELDDTVQGSADEDDEAAYAEEEVDEDVEPEEDEADVETGDEFDGMDRTELKAHLKSLDASFAARKSQTDDDLRELAREAAANAEAAEGADDEEEEDEEEEEPEPPKPAARKRAAKKPAPATDDDLEELDIEDL